MRLCLQRPSLGAMDQSALEQRADHHAQEAERLLAGRLGLINNIIRAGVHATLAVYYSAKGLAR